MLGNEYRKLDKNIKAVDSKIDTENRPLNEDTPNIPAKITGIALNSETKVYNYSWVAVNLDGSENPFGGGSDNAFCIQESGQNMTEEEPSVKIGDIVSMQCDKNGYRFSLAGKKGEMPEFEMTLHEHAIPITQNTGQSNENEAE